MYVFGTVATRLLFGTIRIFDCDIRSNKFFVRKSTFEVVLSEINKDKSVRFKFEVVKVSCDMLLIRFELR